LRDIVRRETGDVTMFCYGLAAHTELNNKRTLARYNVLLQVWTGLKSVSKNTLCVNKI
jgi:hypothetical protein